MSVNWQNCTVDYVYTLYRILIKTLQNQASGSQVEINFYQTSIESQP